ncbi:biotin synthase [Alloscardovia omnicolens]|uniref:biotin synthase n=1 Tax=Alloscardovia omnicolens TaxID=419015 RepID=UPI003A6680F9
MKWPTKDSIIKLAALTLIFWVFPVVSMLAQHVSSHAMWGLIICVLFIFPACTLILSFLDGIKRGFSFMWIVVPLIAFFSTVFVFYNDSAIIYSFVYAIIGLIGNAIGTLIGGRKSRKH